MTLEHDHSQAAEQLELNPGIGAELRYLREQAGMSIEDVAAGTRIQADYLAALEDGRHEDLPGAAYAIGFLRTYSDHLGMDGDEAVERFKDEEAVRTNPTPLVFPAPIGETRRPGWRLALLSLVLAGAVYGTWISIQKIGGVDLERILPPPERLTDFLKSNGSNKAPPPTEEKMAPTGDSPKTTNTGAAKQADDSKAVISKPDVSTKPVTLKTIAGSAATTGPNDRRKEENKDKENDQTAASNNTKPVRAQSSPPVTAAINQTPKPAAVVTRVETAPVQVVPANQGDESGTKPTAETQSAATTVTVEKLTAADATSVASPEETATGQSSDTASDVAATPVPANSTQDVTPLRDESSATLQAGSRPASESEYQTSAGQDETQDDSVAVPREDVENPPPAALPPSPPQIAAIAADPTAISPESRMAEPIPPGQSVALQPEPLSPQGQPRVFGASNAGARVVVKAHSDSWVQVQGPNKETLLTRILHAGDIYLAPSQDGLLLVTGNAGAVEIIVDGESLGMIGEFGQVRRDLSLDPNRVRSELANR